MSQNELLARETRESLAKAIENLKAARVLAGNGLEEPALYHCQQSGEKALKAFLSWHQTPFRKTHNLEELGESCAGIDPSLDPLAATAHALTDYAWKMRYPGDPYVIAEGEVAAMIQLAAEVLDQIQIRLPAEARLQPTLGDRQ